MNTLKERYRQNFYRGKREVDEIVEAIKKLPKSDRTRMFYMIQGAQLIADNSNTPIDRAAV